MCANFWVIDGDRCDDDVDFISSREGNTSYKLLQENNKGSLAGGKDLGSDNWQIICDVPNSAPGPSPDPRLTTGSDSGTEQRSILRRPSVTEQGGIERTQMVGSESKSDKRKPDCSGPTRSSNNLRLINDRTGSSPRGKINTYLSAVIKS